MDEHSAAANDILFDLQDGIGRITFNRPQARNAFTFAMYERLAQICQQADRDPAIKVLVLQGAGDKAFASGTDINQFREFKTPEHALEYEARIDRVLTALEECRVPTLAAITGAAITLEGVQRVMNIVRLGSDLGVNSATLNGYYHRHQLATYLRCCTTSYSESDVLGHGLVAQIADFRRPNSRRR